MNPDEYNEYIAHLCDYIEWYQTMEQQFHAYFNDPVDVDREGCFV